MELVSACPLRVASLLWQARPGAWVFTAICKATFRLEPVVSPLAEEQEHPNDEDNYWDDNPQKSLYAPTDLVPFKTRADVLLVGNAFVAGGARVHSLTARLVVGDIDKSISVYGDRYWAADGRLRETSGFARMSLRYERAAGGPDTINPVGIRPDLANANGEIAVPNLWPLGASAARRGEFVEPVGFGPIAPTWPARREKLGTHGARFPFRDWASTPFPADIDPAFFNSAPRDQQPAELRIDERIIVQNLHPEVARVVTRLPGIIPRGRVERQGASPQELSFRADTLWIDTDRSRVTVTFRAQVPLRSADESGRVLIGMERRGERFDWDEVGRQAHLLAALHKARARELPDVESLSEDDVRETSESFAALVEPHDSGATQDLPLTPNESEANATLFLMGAPASAQTLPFAGTGAQSAGADVFRKAEQAAAATQGKDLPVGWAPPTPFASGQPPANSPLPPTMMFSPTGAPPGVAAPAVPAPPMPAPPPPVMGRPAGYDLGEPNLPRHEPVKEIAVSGALAKATHASGDAVKLGVMGLSDAAAGAHRAVLSAEEPRPVQEPEERLLPPVRRSSEVLKLLWFDPKVVPRLHKHPEWRILLAELELRLLDERSDLDMNDKQKERRCVFEVLSRAIATPLDSLRGILSDAIDETGSFEAPLVALSGEIEFAFDELETLKATVAVLTPLAAAEKRTKDALDMATEFLKTPGAADLTRLAENQTERLREAFLQTRKTLPADYVDSHVDRALLRQRAYAIKTLYGKRWIRTLLRGTGAGSTHRNSAPPAYLPEVLKEELPAYKKIKMKAIGEVDLQEDQEEAATWVVKVLAIGRAISGI